MIDKTSKQQVEFESALQEYEIGHVAEAERICRRILRGRPSYARANLLLGLILKEQHKNDEAVTVLRRVITVDPKAVEAHATLSSIFHGQGKLVEAEAAIRNALALNPNLADAQMSLGAILFDQGRFEESIPWFRSYASQAYGQPGGNAKWPNSAHKSRHDSEQRAYLAESNPTIAKANILFNVSEGRRVPGRAVNPDRSGGEIETKWETISPKVAVIDGLLTDEALEEIQQFCWSSTIWHRSYDDGYLGTVPELGFACPLLAQIADDLRAAYPVILGDHKLTRCWAFKYDSHLKGTNIHADFAAVNVNFWITPDDANLESESGGLVIWDKPASLGLQFSEINNPGSAIKEFLNKGGVKSITVPYRANRAVIFDSDLYHKTDNIAFKEGYLNRRINITMLFGYREGVPVHDHDHDHDH